MMPEQGRFWLRRSFFDPTGTDMTYLLELFNFVVDSFGHPVGCAVYKVDEGSF